MTSHDHGTIRHGDVPPFPAMRLADAKRFLGMPGIDGGALRRLLTTNRVRHYTFQAANGNRTFWFHLGDMEALNKKLRTMNGGRFR